MSRQIIKQPNGEYCIFSNITDNITNYNMSVDDIIEEFVKEAKIKIEEDVKKIVLELENKEKPYHQFTMTYDDMLTTIKERHGKNEMNKIKTLIENT